MHKSHLSLHVGVTTKLETSLSHISPYDLQLERKEGVGDLIEAKMDPSPPLTFRLNSLPTVPL